MFAKALNRNLTFTVQGPLHLRELLLSPQPVGSQVPLDRRFQDLEIRRAFTVFQLMTILEEARHSLESALLTWNRYFPGGYDQKCR